MGYMIEKEASTTKITLTPEQEATFAANNLKLAAKANCTALGGMWNVVTNSCDLPNKTFFQRFGKGIGLGLGALALVFGLPKIMKATKKGKK